MAIFLTLLFIAFISFLLSLFSMRNFAQVQATGKNSALFLISNPSNFSLSVIAKLYDLCIQKKTVISIERLFKGDQKALVIYAPREVVSILPELQLVELLDYISKTMDKTKLNIQNSLVWQSNLNKGVVAENFLQNLKLESKQQFGLQIIASAQKVAKNRTGNFKIEVRLMVSDKDINERIKLAQKINLDLDKAFAQKQTVLQSSPRLFKAFTDRSYLAWGNGKKLDFADLLKYLS